MASQSQINLDALLAGMLGADRTTVKNVTVKHEGAEIILPTINGKDMSYDEGILWLQRRKEEDETKTAIYYDIKCSPMDGAVAFQKAISQVYGFSHGVPTPGFFGDSPPVMIGVQTGVDTKLNVPWGSIQIPGIDGRIEIGMKAQPTPSFLVTGAVKKKHTENVRQLIELTQKILKEDSIYRGKAIKVGFEWLREELGYDPMENCPKFLDLKGIKDDDLIFGDTVMGALEVGLFTPIEQAKACRKFDVPLKRGVLLYGPYGTGKTMTAYVAALKAVRNDWTFIYLDSVADLEEGLRFAAMYAPAVVFAEDIDRLINGSRSMEMDEVLNTLDGVDTKGAEIITVLTTNHIESINPAMLRPGRLDTLVEVSPPDAKAAERLVTLYGRDLLAKDVDLTKVGQALDGKIPAFIREVTERAKIAAIARSNGGDITGDVQQVDLLKAASAMEVHASMLNPKENSADQATSVVLEMRPNNQTVVKKGPNVGILRAASN